MPTLDLSTATELRVAGVDALALRIAGVDVWQRPEPGGTEHPAEVVWTDSIPGSDANGWAATSGPALSTATTNTRSAPRALYRASTASDIGVYAKTVTDLLPGRSYTFEAWFRPASAAVGFSVGVEGIGGAAPSTSAANVYSARSYTFTATATSHTLILTTAGQVRMDDFSLTRDAYTD